MSDEFYKDLAIKLQTASPGYTGEKYMELAVEAMVPVLKQHIALMTNDVREFQRKFGIEYSGGPRALDRNTSAERIAFMQEELDEYQRSHENDDLEGQIDALVDLTYVVIGIALLQGFPFAEAWRRVHAANMKKVRSYSADESKRGMSNDVIKPEGWIPPDHSDLVARFDVDWEELNK